jgi:hypothetical protein
MADLTLQQIADKLPAGSIVQDGNDVTISLKTVTGETAVQLSDAKASEAIAKLLNGCSAAQIAYNTANPSAQISTFSSPAFGIPVNEGGVFVADASYNVTVSVPLNLDNIMGNAQ